MRHLVGLAVALALVALPLSVSAQDSPQDAAESAEPWRHPHDRRTRQQPTKPREPALELKLDDTGVGVIPSPPRTPDGYTVEEMELRVKRARIGVIASAGVVVVGAVLTGVAAAADSDCKYTLIGPDEGSCTDWGFSVTLTGVFLIAGGIYGLAISGGIMAHRKRKLQTHYGEPRRVQWDLARSRLVF